MAIIKLHENDLPTDPDEINHEIDWIETYVLPHLHRLTQETLKRLRKIKAGRSEHDRDQP